MKKTVFIIATIVFCMVSISALASNNTTVQNMFVNVEKIKQTTIDSFVLPDLLKVIEEEAFEGTAVTNMHLPESVKIIGDRAFSNTRNLQHLYIPEETTVISGNILDGTKRVTIIGVSGSFAKEWTQERGIPFLPIAAVMTNSNEQTLIFLTNRKNGTLENAWNIEQSKEWVNTKQGEKTEKAIQTIRYNNFFAFSVQGRSPPYLLQYNYL